ncbi:MAG: hypothetical protein NVS3B10_12100 [Polyangiales bacterium]
MSGPLAALLASASIAVAVASPSASAPTPPATPAPAPVASSPTPAYGFVYRSTPSPETTPFPGPNPPGIAEIDLSGATLVTPGTIRVRVLTTDAVISVAAETFGSSIPIVRAAPGVFTLEGYVPAVPAAFKNRLYDVTFTASAADGRTARVVLPLMLR